MSKAIELAHELDQSHPLDSPTEKAAAHLRALDASHRQLLETLEELLSEADEGISTSPITRNEARIAIATAKELQ